MRFFVELLTLDKAYDLSYDLIMNTSVAIPQNLTVSQARDNLYDLMDEVGLKLRSFIISHRGRPTAVVMPVEDLESWDETLEILSNKKLMKNIAQAKKDYAAGKTVSLEEVEKKLGIYENRT